VRLFRFPFAGAHTEETLRLGLRPDGPLHAQNKRCFSNCLVAGRPRPYQQRLALSPDRLCSAGNSGRRYSDSLKTDLPDRRLFAVVSQYRCASDVSVDAWNGA